MPLSLYPRSNISVESDATNNGENIEESRTENLGKGLAEASHKHPNSTERTKSEHKFQDYTGQDFPRYVNFDNDQDAKGVNTVDEQSCFADEIKKTGRSQTKAFGGHDPNSVVRVGAVKNITLQGMEHMKKENRELRDREMCKICQANKVVIAFVPCGHLVCCERCADRISECVSCKSVINKRVPVRNE